MAEADQVQGKHHRCSARKLRQERRAVELTAARSFGDLPRPGNRRRPKVKHRQAQEDPPSLVHPQVLREKYVNQPLIRSSARAF